LVVFPIRIPAWVFLGVWFVYQLIEANYGLTSPHANESGVAFFAHVGGFIFGMIVARALLSHARSSGAQTLPRGSPSHVSS
jgi:membrane associated rhomboid family serine protease